MSEVKNLNTAFVGLLRCVVPPDKGRRVSRVEKVAGLKIGVKQGKGKELV